jgi:tetratricopeptide (TPR) repeat protein
MDEDNLNEAGRSCDRILNIFPEFDEARSMQDEIDNRYVQAKQFYETIRDGYETIRNGSAKQSCDELLSLLNETVRIYPDHPDGRLIQSQLVSLADEYKDARDRGIEAISKGKFLQAKAVFRQTHQLNPGLARVTELLDFVTRVQEHVESARAAIDAAIERQNWNKALSLARALDAYVDDIKQKGTDCIHQE